MALKSFHQLPGIKDPFYSFNRFKIGTTDQSKTQLASDYMEENTDAAWNRRLAELGFAQSDTSPIAEFARKQYQDSLLGHKTAMIEDPTLGYADYIKKLNLQMFMERFANQTRRNRGENRSQYVGPVRTISNI